MRKPGMLIVEKEKTDMKKKLLVLMLGLAMILSFSFLTACGSNEEAAPEEETAADPVADCPIPGGCF